MFSSILSICFHRPPYFAQGPPPPPPPPKLHPRLLPSPWIVPVPPGGSIAHFGEHRSTSSNGQLPPWNMSIQMKPFLREKQVKNVPSLEHACLKGKCVLSIWLTLNSHTVTQRHCKRPWEISFCDQQEYEVSPPYFLLRRAETAVVVTGLDWVYGHIFKIMIINNINTDI